LRQKKYKGRVGHVPTVALTAEEKKNRYKKSEKEFTAGAARQKEVSQKYSAYQNFTKRGKQEEQKIKDAGVSSIRDANRLQRKILESNNARNDFGCTSNVKIPPADFWVLNEVGILKSVDIDNKTTINYFDGAQMTKEGGLVDICGANSTSLFGLSPEGLVKYFNNGVFTTIYPL